MYPAGDIKYGVEYTGIIEDDELNEGGVPDLENTETSGENTQSSGKAE